MASDLLRMRPVRRPRGTAAATDVVLDMPGLILPPTDASPSNGLHEVLAAFPTADLDDALATLTGEMSLPKMRVGDDGVVRLLTPDAAGPDVADLDIGTVDYTDEGLRLQTLVEAALGLSDARTELLVDASLGLVSPDDVGLDPEVQPQSELVVQTVTALGDALDVGLHPAKIIVWFMAFLFWIGAVYAFVPFAVGLMGSAFAVEFDLFPSTNAGAVDAATTAEAS